LECGDIKVEKYNLKKEEQLGMSSGKANAILKKGIMFMLIQKCNMDTCYRCGEKIETVDELSIDHMENWLDSDFPQELYFDLDNISFSHYSCNIDARRRTPRKPTYTKEEMKERNRERMRKVRSTDKYKEKMNLYMRSRKEDPEFRKKYNETSKRSYYKNKEEIK